jgi:hypothetical protein
MNPMSPPCAGAAVASERIPGVFEARAARFPEKVAIRRWRDRGVASVKDAGREVLGYGAIFDASRSPRRKPRHANNDDT